MSTVTTFLAAVTARVTVALTKSVCTAAAALLAVAAASAVATSPASASPTPADDPGRASFQGRSINLAAGWHGAQTCVVFSVSDVRCYASHQEADEILGYTRATDPLYQQAVRASGGIGLAATPACAYSWLCLYEHTNGGGRRLIFRDEYWQYLSNWNFDRQTSSWRNNQGLLDGGHLSMYNLGSAYTMSSNTYVANLGIYNDQAYAVAA